MTESPKPQLDRFKEVARQLGCDEDEKAFDEKLKEIAGPKAKPAAAISPAADEALERFERNLPRNHRDKG